MYDNVVTSVRTNDGNIYNILINIRLYKRVGSEPLSLFFFLMLVLSLAYPNLLGTKRLCCCCWKLEPGYLGIFDSDS
jgi:hypothetical protein